MSQEKETLWASMYNSDDIEKPQESSSNPQIGGLKKSRRMVMGAVSFDVPTTEYVESLERRVVIQDRQLSEQARRIKQLEVLFSAMKNVVRKNMGVVNEVSRDLENKLDRRDI